MEATDLQLQRMYDRVTLVSGMGDPRRDTACLMSLVARLAEEANTDAPRCASPMITAFVIPVNDRMPFDARQRLKPFAPRIIGTRDGLDPERVVVLHAVMTAEILPKITAQFRAAPAAGRFARALAALQRCSLHGHVLRLLREVEADPQPGQEVALARSCGQLLALCASMAQDPRDATWRWNAAIGLLDRMCDVGAASRAEPPLAIPQPAPRSEGAIAE
jgi:hypothetical protein